MIFLFGASSDIGRRATSKLLDAGLDVHLVATRPDELDARASRLAGNIASVAPTVPPGATVISCAHARYTKELLDALPATRNLVLIGSAWRYSTVPNEKADQLRAAQAVFIESRRSGVMMHPTMIYGGEQEKNLHRLMTVIRRTPLLPMPGGGRHLVQPIHVDDVADCIVAAALRDWSRPTVIRLAGPEPMPWRTMVAACAEALGRRPVMVPVPLGPAIRLLKVLGRFGLSPIDVGMLLRFNDSTSVSPAAMQKELNVLPRDFRTGLRQALREWGLAEQSARIAK